MNESWMDKVYIIKWLILNTYCDYEDKLMKSGKYLLKGNIAWCQLSYPRSL